MAANKILEEFYAFVNFARDGFKYNLQVFPDTITAASLLFSLLFQSPPLAALIKLLPMMQSDSAPLVAGHARRLLKRVEEQRRLKEAKS